MPTDAPASPAAPPRTTIRSVAAIALGFLLMGGLAVLMDVVLEAAGIFPPDAAMSGFHLGLAMTYRLVFTVAGGYATARAAPDKPLVHAVILGFVGSVIALVGAAAVARQAPGSTPLWYPLAIIGATMPCCGLGGLLGARR
jgi:hypothetical protein